MENHFIYTLSLKSHWELSVRIKVLFSFPPWLVLIEVIFSDSSEENHSSVWWQNLFFHLVISHCPLTYEWRVRIIGTRANVGFLKNLVGLCWSSLGNPLLFLPRRGQVGVKILDKLSWLGWVKNFSFFFFSRCASLEADLRNSLRTAPSVSS